VNWPCCFHYANHHHAGTPQVKAAVVARGTDGVLLLFVPSAASPKFPLPKDTAKKLRAQAQWLKDQNALLGN
jgi:hypothetical protein